jgi:NADH-quinone oxidoreductase subunit H
MISYEAALGMSVATVVLVTAWAGGYGAINPLTTRAIVASQAPSAYMWNIIRTGLIPFVIFLIAITAEMNRPPFDLVEAEQELVGGFNTEYSSLRFGMFYMAEYMNTITMSAIVVTLFLGGPDGPGFHFLTWLWPILWFLGKTLAFLFVYVWIRASLPRLRYDQLMDMGWKVLIPLSLGWILVLAGVLTEHYWFLLLVLVGALLALAMRRAISLGHERSHIPPALARRGSSSILRGGSPVPGTPVPRSTSATSATLVPRGRPAGPSGQGMEG